ncbi:MAG TPA: hypothetical protein VFI78_00440 [Salinimicrobium sp.]|nr:hypothetical protein [Salinimicrobium sp.]
MRNERIISYVSKNIPNLVHPTNSEGEDVYAGINFKFFADYAFSAGSIASTLEDMAKFYGCLYEKEKLLEKETFNRMIDFQEGSYGLGIQKLMINGKKFIGHGENNYGYAFRNYYNPETGEMILYFNNRFRTVLKNSLLNDLTAYLNEKPIQEFPDTKKKEFIDFIGEYNLEGPNLKFSITAEDNLLFLVVDGFKAPLISYKPNELFDGTSGITFIKDPNKPNRLIWKQGGHKLIANKIGDKEEN